MKVTLNLKRERIHNKLNLKANKYNLNCNQQILLIKDIIHRAEDKIILKHNLDYKIKIHINS